MTTDRPAGEPTPDDARTAPTGPDTGSGSGPAGDRAAGAEGVAGEGDDATAGSGGSGAKAGVGRSAAAEALAAAVRAVESGERSAASFFTEQSRPAAVPGAAGRANAPTGPGPTAGGSPSAGPAASGPGTGSGGPGAYGQGRSDAAHGLAGGGPVGAPGGPAAAGGSRRGLSGLPPTERQARSATVREVLGAGGAPEALADKVLDVFGDRAAQALREDPWQLLAVPGVRPEQADGFARALLGAECGPADERRARALVQWLLERAALEGHTALEPATLSSALAQRSVPDAEAALRTAIADGAVLVFRDALDAPGSGPMSASSSSAASEGDEENEEQPVRVLVGLDRYALAEESLADGLARLVNTFDPESGSASAPGVAAVRGADGEQQGADAQAAEGSATVSGPSAATAPSAADWRAAAEAAPSPSAAELISAVAGSGLVAHTGGEAARAEPAAMVAAARALGLRAYAAAHSEDGRQRLAAMFGTAASAGSAIGGPAPAAAGQHGASADEAPGGTTDSTTDGRTRESGEAAGDSGPSGGVDSEGGGPPEGAGRAAPGVGGAETAPSSAGGLGPAAVTVAGLLAGVEGPGRDAEGALAVDVLAVLDAPQLDVETAAMLVESLPDGARLVLSGDPGVLWSAGPGKVFADLLAARTCPQVASRTPDPGPIGELVSGIGIGELSQVDAPGKEVVIVPVRDAGEAVHRTVQLVADSVPRAIGVPADHTQVITPGHGGAAGTRALNAALKDRINPGPGRFGGFDPGDRVAYVPAPGRSLPGTVVSADAEGLHLDCAGAGVIIVPRDRVSETVRHGWALTAHQAAGMRWPAAVVVLPGDAVQALTRSWVYTAFSRGERHLSVVHGADQALPRAVAEVPVKERTTRLRTLLRSSAPPDG
ncbi:helix-hairpin-helix domain-containing protein [Streptomyces sp. 7N604]|uniref:helix-hairpin-helix domain-containing protein n=1 Tax=Streptomyces sp. 7N604 TaxID=3457415 RepID=UPI003FD32445